MNRKEWLEARRSGLGGSDIAAILGISPWATEMDVYLDKMGLRKDEDSNAKQRGRIFEKALAEWYAEENNVEVTPGVHFQGEVSFMMASPDFWVSLPGEVQKWGLECKTSRSTKGWGEEMTDQIPAYYATQCHWYMMVTGKDVWDVVVYFTLQDEFRQYRLHKDKELHEKMYEKARDWWNAHIVEQVPPAIDGSKASDTLLQHNFPEDTGEVREPTDREVALFAELHSINKALKDLQEHKSNTVNLIKEQMGDTTVIQGDTGKVSWKLGNGRRTLDTKAIRKDHPELADQYTKVSDPSRTFRFTYNEG
jgi:putative phage-type endonuclease